MECARGIGACAQGRHACRRGVKQGSTHATLHACKCFSRHPVQASYLQVSTSFRQVSGLGNPVTQHPSLESAWVSWPSRRICPWRGACALDRETTQADSGLGCLVTGLPKDMSTHATLTACKCFSRTLDLPARAQRRHARRRGVKQGSTHATLHACKCFSRTLDLP